MLIDNSSITTMTPIIHDVMSIMIDEEHHPVVIIIVMMCILLPMDMRKMTGMLVDVEVEAGIVVVEGVDEVMDDVREVVLGIGAEGVLMVEGGTREVLLHQKDVPDVVTIGRDWDRASVVSWRKIVGGEKRGMRWDQKRKASRRVHLEIHLHHERVVGDMTRRIEVARIGIIEMTRIGEMAAVVIDVSALGVEAGVAEEIVVISAVMARVIDGETTMIGEEKTTTTTTTTITDRTKAMTMIERRDDTVIAAGAEVPVGLAVDRIRERTKRTRHRHRQVGEADARGVRERVTGDGAGEAIQTVQIVIACQPTRKDEAGSRHESVDEVQVKREKGLIGRRTRQIVGVDRIRETKRRKKESERKVGLEGMARRRNE